MLWFYNSPEMIFFPTCNKTGCPWTVVPIRKSRSLGDDNYTFYNETMKAKCIMVIITISFKIFKL